MSGARLKPARFPRAGLCACRRRGSLAGLGGSLQGAQHEVRIEQGIVRDHEHAVLRHGEVGLERRDADRERTLECNERILRREAARAAVTLEVEGVRARGEYLREKLLELSAERGFEGERGEGLLRALLLGKDIGTQIVEKARLMQPDGLLLNAARPNLLRFMPALNVTNEEIDQMMAMLRTILDSL